MYIGLLRLLARPAALSGLCWPLWLAVCERPQSVDVFWGLCWGGGAASDGSGGRCP